MATETQTTGDNFDAAFASIAALESSASPAAIAAATQAQPEKKEGDQVQVETPAAATTTETPAGEVQKTPEEIEAERVAAEEAAKAVTEAAAEEGILNKFVSAVRKAIPEPEPARQEPVQQQQRQEPASPYNADEQAFLTKYMTDFPDIAQAEFLRRKAEYGVVIDHVFAEFRKTIEPMARQLQTIADRTHLGDLVQTVPTYATDRDKVVEWVKEQPDYLRAAYEGVIAAGTVDQVADLINRWKQSTGVVQTISGTTEVKPATELPAAAKKAVAALAPVSSKRSVAVAAEPTDFDSAFAAFAAPEKV